MEGASQNGMMTSAFAEMFNECMHPQATNAYAENKGKTVIIEYDNGTEEIRTGGSLAWRNNNPGNIGEGYFADNNGAIGAWAIFPDSKAGYQAMIDNLNTSDYQNKTMGGAITKWAPSSENDTVAYIAFVSHATGIASTTPMSSLNNAQIQSMANAMKKYEGWYKTGEISYR